MLENYGHILIYIFMVAGICFALLTAAIFISRKITKTYLPNDVKSEAFECGYESEGDARSHFNIRFYLIAILFIIFDLEMAFLVPWAFVYKKVSTIGFYSMIIFLLLLFIGFLYEWKKGALEWA